MESLVVTSLFFLVIMAMVVLFLEFGDDGGYPERFSFKIVKSIIPAGLLMFVVMLILMIIAKGF